MSLIGKNYVTFESLLGKNKVLCALGYTRQNYDIVLLLYVKSPKVCTPQEYIHIRKELQLLPQKDIPVNYQMTGYESHSCFLGELLEGFPVISSHLM